MDKPISVEMPMTVAFYDVDSYRVVWHGAYPKYLEIVRGELLKEIGYTYADMEGDSFFFPVIDLQIKYIDSMVVNQEFVISATLKKWEHKLVIDYLIVDSKTKKKVTKAQTSQVAVRMPEKITQFEAPAQLKSAVESYLQRNQ